MLRKCLMYHTKSMEYIWAKPRDREIYEKSDSRVGENATVGENGRFAWDIRQKKGVKVVVVVVGG